MIVNPILHLRSRHGVWWSFSDPLNRSAAKDRNYKAIREQQPFCKAAANRSRREKASGEKGPARPRSNLAPTLYHGVSATRATETGRDPSSPITLMYRSQVCRYPVALRVG